MGRGKRDPHIQRQDPDLKRSAIEWLLGSDPSIRWQVLRDLTGESNEVVAAERPRLALEGWVARLLELQGSDGNWGGDAYVAPGWRGCSDPAQPEG